MSRTKDPAIIKRCKAPCQFRWEVIHSKSGRLLAGSFGTKIEAMRWIKRDSRKIKR